MSAFAQRGRTAAIIHGRLAALAIFALCLSGCDQLFQDHTKRSLDQADKKYAEGDYQGAMRYYEDSLDGTAASAEVHYKLALLFDDKLKNPLGAMYHFQRYLDLKPSGPHAGDAKAFMKEDELKLVASLSRGALMSQEDAARLKNDNLALRKQVMELRAVTKGQVIPPYSVGSSGTPGTPPPGATTYEVQHGDTLASIARKFYKNSARWKDIEDANFNQLNGKANLKPGMTLIIPK